MNIHLNRISYSQIIKCGLLNVDDPVASNLYKHTQDRALDFYFFLNKINLQLCHNKKNSSQHFLNMFSPLIDDSLRRTVKNKTMVMGLGVQQPLVPSQRVRGVRGDASAILIICLYCFTSLCMLSCSCINEFGPPHPAHKSFFF